MIQYRPTNTLLLGTKLVDCLPFFLTGTVAMIVQVTLTNRASKVGLIFPERLRVLLNGRLQFFFFMGHRSLRVVFLVCAGVGILGGWLASFGAEELPLQNIHQLIRET